LPIHPPLGDFHCLVGPTCWCGSPTRTHTFSRCPTGPARQPGHPFARPLSLTRGSHLSNPSLPNRPRMSRVSSWTPRPRRTPRSRPSPPRPFSSCLVPHSLPFPLTRSLAALSTRLAPRAHLGSSVAIRRGLAPILRSPSSPRRVCCLNELRLVTCVPGHPWVHPLSLCFSWSTLTGSLSAPSQLRRRRPVSLSCLGRCS
jgi:hypothetical protein